MQRAREGPAGDSVQTDGHAHGLRARPREWVIDDNCHAAPHARQRHTRPAHARVQQRARLQPRRVRPAHSSPRCCIAGLVGVGRAVHALRERACQQLARLRPACGQALQM